jgi:hypothetical protein
MATKGTNKKADAKGTKDSAKAADNAAETTVPTPKELMTAKDKNDAARKKLQQVKAKIRRAKQLKEKFSERKAKKEAAIARAKAGTTKSAEELLSKADEFDKEAAKLLKENKALLGEFEKMDGELGELDQELKEIRAQNKKSRKSNGTTRTGSVAAAKAALVKALGRRTWVVHYDNDGAAEWATKSQGGVDARIDFTDENWTTKVGDDTKTHQYGAGAIQIADGLFPKEGKGDKAKTKAA